MFDSVHIKFKDGETTTTPVSEDLFGQKSSNDKNFRRMWLKHFIQQWHKDNSLPGKQDIHTGIVFLCTWVQEPNEEDWEKLIRWMKYLNGTKDLVLTLSADQLNILKWYVDAVFAVPADFWSHTGMAMTMGQGTTMSMS